MFMENLAGISTRTIAEPKLLLRGKVYFANFLGKSVKRDRKRAVTRRVKQVQEGRAVVRNIAREMRGNAHRRGKKSQRDDVARRDVARIAWALHHPT